MGENEIITVVGVRAGINPAPTTPPDGTRMDGYRFHRRGGVYPRPPATKQIKICGTGGK